MSAAMKRTRNVALAEVLEMMATETPPTLTEWLHLRGVILLEAARRIRTLPEVEAP